MKIFNIIDFHQKLIDVLTDQVSSFVISSSTQIDINACSSRFTERQHVLFYYSSNALSLSHTHKNTKIVCMPTYHTSVCVCLCVCPNIVNSSGFFFFAPWDSCKPQWELRQKLRKRKRLKKEGKSRKYNWRDF